LAPSGNLRPYPCPPRPLRFYGFSLIVPRQTVLFCELSASLRFFPFQALFLRCSFSPGMSIRLKLAKLFLPAAPRTAFLERPALVWKGQDAPLHPSELIPALARTPFDNFPFTILPEKPSRHRASLPEDLQPSFPSFFQYFLRHSVSLFFFFFFFFGLNFPGPFLSPPRVYFSPLRSLLSKGVTTPSLLLAATHLIAVLDENSIQPNGALAPSRSTSSVSFPLSLLPSLRAQKMAGLIFPPRSPSFSPISSYRFSFLQNSLCGLLPLRPFS